VISRPTTEQVLLDLAVTVERTGLDGVSVVVMCSAVLASCSAS
jgi:hypothetical protein